MTKLRLVREGNMTNPGPGKNKGWFKSNLAVIPTAMRAQPTHPKGGLSVPVVWIHTSFVHPNSQDALRDHRYYPFRPSSTQGAPSYPLDGRSIPTALPTAGRSPATTPCGPSWTGGLSISQLHTAYMMTFRPIIVHAGRLVGRGPVYS